MDPRPEALMKSFFLPIRAERTSHHFKISAMKEMFWRLLLVGLFFCFLSNLYHSVRELSPAVDEQPSPRFQKRDYAGTMGRPENRETSAIDSILVLDKSGRHDLLPASPAVEVRFTDTANRKTVFYFDLLRLKNDTVFGGESRILSFLRKAIPLQSVRKIEIQNGRKNFRYVN